jgi:dUTP pyrophosphatase
MTTIFLEINYLKEDTKRLEKIEQGDWIDLYADESYDLNPGDFALISLGVVIKLPEGYEAHIAPRSSTFKNFGVIQTNSVGIVDESYCGPNDVWKWPAFALRSSTIRRGDKICQFRVMKKMEKVIFNEIEEVSSPDRGGFGSTGTR